MRIVASRGSMDLGESDGGLPPDSLVEDDRRRSSPTPSASPALADGDRVGIAVAPCSPFSVTTRLMEESAALARRLGLQLHTHLAETVEEDAYCRELFGCTPVEYLERVGWLAERRLVRALRPPLGRRRRRRSAAHGVGVAHCPTSNLRLGAGVAPVRDLLDAGVRVGLGVDGTASNERGDLFVEVKQALLVARGRGGPGAMTARDALRLGDARRRRRCCAATTSARSSRASAPTSRSGAPTASSSAAPTTSSRTSSSAARTASTGCSSAASDVVRGGALVRADEQEIAREHRKEAAEAMADDRLDPRARHRARPAGRGRARRAVRARTASLVGAGVTDDDGRIARARRVERRHLPDRLPPAVAVLQARRARGRARRGPLPRPAADLVVRVRELPRQLTRRASSRSCSRDARASSSGSRRWRTRSAAPARWRSSCPTTRRRSVLDAHPAIGAQGDLRRAPPPSRAATTTRTCSPSSHELNAALRGEVRLPLRRLRQPPARGARSCRSCASASSARRERGARDRASTSSSRSRSTDGSRPSALRLLVGLGQPPLPLAARDRRDRVDRRVLLLHRARQPPRAARGPATTRERGVGGEAWEIHGGGFYRVEKFRVAPDRLPEPLHWFKWEAYTTWLSGFALFVVVYYAHATTYLIDPSRRRPRGVAGDRDLDRRARARVARLRRALPRRSASDEGAARRARLRVHLRVRVGGVASSSRRGRRTSRSAR